MKIGNIQVWLEGEEFPAEFKASSLCRLEDGYLGDDTSLWVTVIQVYATYSEIDYFPKSRVLQISVEEYPDDVEFA